MSSDNQLKKKTLRFPFLWKTQKFGLTKTLPNSQLKNLIQILLLLHFVFMPSFLEVVNSDTVTLLLNAEYAGEKRHYKIKLVKNLKTIFM